MACLLAVHIFPWTFLKVYSKAVVYIFVLHTHVLHVCGISFTLVFLPPFVVVSCV